jgi:hypothetical protein
MCEEMRAREAIRRNVIVHGVPEPDSGTKTRKERRQTSQNATTSSRQREQELEGETSDFAAVSESEVSRKGHFLLASKQKLSKQKN